MKQEAPYQDDSQEPTKRLSVNLPESLHTRFKTACSATNRRMVREILGFVARRTEELEQETGLHEGRWAKPAPPRPPRLSATAKRQLRALDRRSSAITLRETSTKCSPTSSTVARTVQTV